MGLTEDGTKAYFSGSNTVMDKNPGGVGGVPQWRNPQHRYEGARGVVGGKAAPALRTAPETRQQLTGLEPIKNFIPWDERVIVF